MKELKFKTSKGEFLMVDDVNGIGKFIPYDLITKIGYVKNLTEEQASEIVEGYKGYYNTYTEEECGSMTNTAIESLHSLLKSKGIHLFENPYSVYDMSTWHNVDKEKQEAEQKTFYNPYIFKI